MFSEFRRFNIIISEITPPNRNQRGSKFLELSIFPSRDRNESNIRCTR